MKKGYLICVPWELHHQGGVNQVVINLYKELEKHSHYKPNIHLGVSKQENSNESPVICTNSLFPFVYKNTQGFKKLFKYLLVFPLQIFLWNIKLLTQNIACINVHYVTPYYYFLCILKKYSIKNFTLIFSLHGTDLANMKQNKAFWLGKFTHVDRIVTCSDYLKDELLDLFPSLEEKVVTIYNGTSIPDNNAVSLLPEKEDYLVSVGTFNENKGHSILIKAFAELIQKKDVSSKLKLVLIGSSTPYLNTLNNLVAKYNLEQRVLFFTDIPNPIVIATIHNAKLFLLASKKEAFGLVALEAGIVSTPLLVFKTGGLTEFINDGVTGTLLTDNTYLSWQLEIRKALNNIEYYKELAERFRNEIETKFSWKECARNYCKRVYK
jgi:glycosyltransferase involved in cell wall biosynthesis